MKVTVEIELKPFRVPNFVLADKKTSDGHNDTKFALEDLSAETLEKLCEDFVAEVFRKAGKDLPDREGEG